MSEAEAKPKPVLDPHSYTILIVDDERANLAVVVDYLAQSGFQIKVARTGEAGLELALRTPPDLVLLDVRLPGIDGFEVCRRLKATEQTRDIPVIFMTILTRLEDKVQGFEVGGVDYISKPFQREEVLARVTTHLTLHQLRQELRELNRSLEDRIAQRTADLARVNRTLNILSACNQVVVRATEEPALLQDICRIIVDLGGYPMAWVGFADHNAAQMVRPVAQAGFEDSYPDTINITWDNTEHGQATSGEAIRSGQPCIVKNIQTDPRFAPWREEALRRGYVSSIALPLQDNEQVLGVLNIYAPSPDAFHAQEANLLTELANDLAFGITSLRERAERKRAEEALRQSEERYRSLYEDNPSMYFTIDSAGNVLSVNQFGCEQLGYTAQELLGQPVLQVFHHQDRDTAARNITHCTENLGRVFHWELRKVRRAGDIMWVKETARAIQGADGQIVVFIVCEDITERKQAEEEREKLQAQLLQAQKMELLGRLAGGVAHDFNNMLGVILGHTELALMEISPSTPLYTDLQEIEKAVQRSAGLTRQLLGFARKQPIAPTVLNLNDVVAGMLNMLRRLIGEDIDLIWVPEADLWPVKMDTSQIDQLLTNLCVNARDAIAGVGQIIIKTKNTVFDESYCASHAGFIPGEYVLLAISDTGCGMDEETLGHLFEPFFTTKGVGHGTGLGLATVYGIVKQNGGFIHVNSEPNKGASFQIYLPRHTDRIAQTRTSNVSMEHAVRGQETVLLVEDEPGVLVLCQKILERLGYRVLSTDTPGKAIRLTEEQAGEIHLLITDVVMPEMNGTDLARRLQSRYPNLKCLFMSGYTADIITHQGSMGEGIHLLQKPFSVNDLAVYVRKALDQKPAGHNNLVLDLGQNEE